MPVRKSMPVIELLCFEEFLDFGFHHFGHHIARQIFDDLADITRKVNKGDGALGRLINDREMGRRLDSLIRQVARAIEDLDYSPQKPDPAIR